MSDNDNSNSAAETGNPDFEEKMPGRTVGFVIMFLMIASVAVILSRHSEQADSTPAASVDQSLDAFRSDAWMLPDDEMLGFVEIPAGAFTMGSNPTLDRMAYENERWSSSSRQGTVDLPTFYISRYEVTIAQFREFAEATGLPVIDGPDGPAAPGRGIVPPPPPAPMQTHPPERPAGSVRGQRAEGEESAPGTASVGHIS